VVPSQGLMMVISQRSASDRKSNFRSLPHAERFTCVRPQMRRGSAEAARTLAPRRPFGIETHRPHERPRGDGMDARETSASMDACSPTTSTWWPGLLGEVALQVDVPERLLLAHVGSRRRCRKPDLCRWCCLTGCRTGRVSRALPRRAAAARRRRTSATSLRRRWPPARPSGRWATGSTLFAVDVCRAAAAGLARARARPQGGAALSRLRRAGQLVTGHSSGSL
jgi:hypothetical protein